MVREQVDAIGLGTPYRLATTGLAELLFRVPALEAIFVQASRRLWRARRLDESSGVPPAAWQSG